MQLRACLQACQRDYSTLSWERQQKRTAQVLTATTKAMTGMTVGMTAWMKMRILLPAAVSQEVDEVNFLQPL